MTNRRRGFTLNEMLIVVAVLAALAAMTWPSLRKPLARFRLAAAAKELRAELVRTRLQAIQRGEPLQFRYVPGAARYRVESLRSALASRHSTAPTAGAWDGGFSNAVDDLKVETSDSSAEPMAPKHDKENSLPEEISFASLEDDLANPLADPVGWQSNGSSGVEPLTASLIEGTAESEIGSQLAETWSPPIVFYPNGRSTDAEIALVGDRDYRVRLSLRGATGTVSVGKVERPAADRVGEGLVEPAAEVEPRLTRETSSGTSSGSLVQR